MEKTEKQIIEDQRKYIIDQQEFIVKLNKKLKTWLYSFLILLIITMIISFWYMFGGAGECQNDPFRYGVEVIADNWNGDILCSCSFYGKNNEIESFSFHNKDYVPLKIYQTWDITSLMNFKDLNQSETT